MSGPDMRLTHRRDDGHWLTFNEAREVVGCLCGFTADQDDCGFGDSVLDHFEAVIRAEQDDAIRNASRLLHSIADRVGDRFDYVIGDAGPFREAAEALDRLVKPEVER